MIFEYMNIFVQWALHEKATDVRFCNERMLWQSSSRRRRRPGRARNTPAPAPNDSGPAALTSHMIHASRVA